MLLNPALAISAVLFTLGVLGVLLRRNAIVIFMCVELMLNAVNLTFVALAQSLGLGGQVFVFFMLVLVLGASFAVMFVGWEGVGLCSYLLIGFWYGDAANANAGRKAFIMNRIGDFGFMVAMFMIFWEIVE